MEILLWLVPPAVVTVLAMVWVSWVGRSGRDEADRRDEVAYERFSRAIIREHPGAGTPRPSRDRDRSTGIAVRPSRGGSAVTGDRGGADPTLRVVARG